MLWGRLTRASASYVTRTSHFGKFRSRDASRLSRWESQQRVFHQPRRFLNLAMSSSEAENFDIDNVSGSEYDSDDYVPAKKKAVSTPKFAVVSCSNSG